MIKRALSVALLGLIIGCIGQTPAQAVPAISGVAAPYRIADSAVIKVGGICLTEIPIVLMFAVFYELTRDKEIDCYWSHNRDQNAWRAYEEAPYPPYKDTPYAPPPKHPKDRH